MPLEPTAAIIDAVLTDHPEVQSRRLDATHWSVVLPGTVRFAVPVAIELGPATTTLTSFLLRGPRGRPAELHRLLLRRNLAARRVTFALDRDDDVVLVARLATQGLSAAELEQCLAEILLVSDQAFEPLVHLAYPGVFPPLPR